MYICICQGVSDTEIKKAICDGADCFDALSSQLGVASCCGQCDCDVRKILHESLSEHKSKKCENCPKKA